MKSWFEWGVCSVTWMSAKQCQQFWRWLIKSRCIAYFSFCHWKLENLGAWLARGLFSLPKKRVIEYLNWNNSKLFKFLHFF